MKVIHVINGLGRGGAEQFLSRLIDHLPPRITSEVISLRGIEPVGTELLAKGVRVTDLGGIGRLGAFSRLRTELAAARPDVVHTWMYHADLYGGLAARSRATAPVVWCIRRTNLDGSYTKRSTRLAAHLSALLSGALPSRIICCAEAARASHVQLGYAAHKMIVIGNGVETDRYLPSAAARRSARAEWGTRPEQPVIGMVGRYHRVKNHAGFLQMAQRIRQQVPDAHFVLAGEGVDSANAELMALISSAALGPAVTLLGRQSAMHQVFPGLDLLVSASLTEGFPNVIAEAMSCGVVCVGTDVGDTRRIIGDCGLLASLPDADELASNVIGLLSLPADSRRELSERGRRRILEDFSMKTAAARYAEVYDGLRSR